MKTGARSDYVSLLRLIAFLCVPGVTLASTACDGFIQVRGAAYEWLNAPPGASSQAFIDRLPPVNEELRPLEDVSITVYHGAAYGDDPIDPTTPWQETTTSDVDGRFETSALTAFEQFEAALVAQKQGFHRIRVSFLHDRFEHLVTLFFVRVESPQIRDRRNDPRNR